MTNTIKAYFKVEKVVADSTRSHEGWRSFVHVQQKTPGESMWSLSPSLDMLSLKDPESCNSSIAMGQWQHNLINQDEENVSK